MKLHEIQNEEILINRMYAGSYLENEHNIGHEVINLLRADGDVDENGDGRNYIYVQPWGTMQAKHNGKIDTIILTRNTEISGAFEVLAQAWDLEQIAEIEKDTHKKEIEKIAKKQLDYIKNNNITYNNKLLNEIYYGNTFQKEVCVSFKANKLRKPKKSMFIYFGKGDDTKKIKVLEDKGAVIYLNSQDIEFVNKSDNITNSVNSAKSSLKMYIKNGTVKKNKEEFVDQTNAFQKLKGILEDASYWEDKNTTQNVLDVGHFYKYDKSNFIDLIDKQNAEATYSNLFKYIFESDRELFKKFAQDVLGICNISDKYTVEREKEHIDLLVTDENNVIVIENKIKSGINGVQYDVYGDIIGSQLKNYYQYVTEKFEDKKKWFFIFAPDYNQINTSEIKSVPDTYKVIPYSRIYEFFDRFSYEDMVKYAHKIQYFYEFIYAIEKHINSVDNILEIETHKKFIKKIQKMV